MKKYINLISNIILILVVLACVIFNIVTKFKYPDYTDTRLLLEFWKFYLLYIVVALSSFLVSIATKK